MHVFSPSRIQGEGPPYTFQVNAFPFLGPEEEPYICEGVAILRAFIIYTMRANLVPFVELCAPPSLSIIASVSMSSALGFLQPSLLLREHCLS